jgi:Leucine-rich repeat (LRR) protein
VLEAKYPFIREDVFLIARVYEHDRDFPDDYESAGFDERDRFYKGKQDLVMRKVNLDTKEVEVEDHIECIHTAILSVPVEEFLELDGDYDAQEAFHKKTLNIRSSEALDDIDVQEGVNLINLPIEEKFLAFKSWVQGIAEAGLDAFSLQDGIDRNLDLMYPIASFLLKFMIKVETNFIPMFLSKIERECVFNGKMHEPSLFANLEMIIENFFYQDSEINISDDIKRSIILDNQIQDIISHLLEINSQFLFDYKDIIIRAAVASNKNACNFPQFINFFDNDNIQIQEALIKNPRARELFPKKWRSIPKKYKDFIIVGEEFEFIEEILLYTDDFSIIQDVYRDAGCVIEDGHITQIGLNGEVLEIIPMKFKKLKKLRRIDIFNYDLDNIPRCLFEKRSVKELGLYDNKIKIIPERVTSMFWLESLDLNNNRIDTLPDHFSKLKNLKKLILSYNNFVHFPSVIKNNKFLLELMIDNNKLKDFSSSICDFSELNWLQLNNNLITKIPYCIKDLKNLKVLMLHNNMIKYLPKSIKSLKSLKFISFSGINFDNLSKETVKWLISLNPFHQK